MEKAAMGDATSQTASAANAARGVRSISNRILVAIILSLRVWGVSQFRPNLIRLLELGARFRLLSFLMKGQTEIIVCFGIARLEAYGLTKLCPCLGDIAGLQQHQPKIVVSFREIGITAHEFSKDIGGAGGIVVLAQNQSQLDPCVGVFGIEADSFLEFASRFV